MYETTKSYKIQVLEKIRSTWNTPHLSVSSGYPYPLLTRKHGIDLEIDHTDGIGTKGLLHWYYGTFSLAVQDALAMNLNDLLVARAIPYKLQNHLVIPQDDHEVILEIVDRLVEECIDRQIAVTGGETSIQNNLEGMELSLTVSGFVPNPKQNSAKNGDILIGIPSNGLHSNGFTFVRHHLGISLELTAPTIIYYDKVFPYIDKINGMIHVAGGGFSRLYDLIGYYVPQRIIIEKHSTLPVFKDLYNKIRIDERMYTTFNCGIGMILSVNSNFVDELVEKLNGEIIGTVQSYHKNEVVIAKSAFTKQQVIL